MKKQHLRISENKILLQIKKSTALFKMPSVEVTELPTSEAAAVSELYQLRAPNAKLSQLTYSEANSELW